MLRIIKQSSFLIIVLVILAATPYSYAQPASARTLMQFDEATLARGAIVFQRGVFRIDDDGQNVTPLCIPVKGTWKQVGTLRECGDSPPPAQRREVTRFTPDITYLGVRNLGIASEQWDTAKKMRSGIGSANALKKVGEAFSYSVTASDTRWRFESAKLPKELKTDIPGSGIHMHFGGLFSDDRRLPIVEAGSGDIEIEARLSMPILVRTGRAHSGLTLAVDLDLPTASGAYITVPLIVDLLHPGSRGREHVGSDGRTNFATTWLAPGNKYVQSIENPQRTGAWSTLDRFAFRISRENVARVAADLNRRQIEAGTPRIDERALDRAKIAGVTLRNESRFLQDGDVTVEVVVDYLRISRAAPHR